MFGPTVYLEWARRYAGKVPFDLATSGISTVPMSELGVPPADKLDDWSGLHRLRDAVAAHNAVPAGEAVAALGTTQALWLAYVSLTSPGDDVLVEEPAYEPLVRIAEGVGARVVRFARDSRDNFALDSERIAAAMTPRTRLVVVTNLHNPTGVRASTEEIMAVARVADRHGANLLVDEVYAAFDARVDDRGVFLGSARRLARNVVAVSSLTKCYGLGPARVGWLLGPAEVVTRAEDAMTACCGNLPLAHSHIALRALDRIPFLANRARTLLQGKRARVAAWVNENASLGITWSAPAEGLFALVTVAGGGDLTSTIEAAARDRGVLVTPGAFFGMPNAFRIAWSAPASALEEGLTRLRDVLRQRS